MARSLQTNGVGASAPAELSELRRSNSRPTPTSQIAVTPEFEEIVRHSARIHLLHLVASEVADDVGKVPFEQQLGL